MRVSEGRARRLAIIAGMALLGLVASTTAALAVNPASTTTTTGQELSVEIESPTDGATLAVGTAVDVSGNVGVGGAGGDLGALMIDLSGSTSLSAGDCNGDGTVDEGDNFNGDFSDGDILDCELFGSQALLDSLSGSGASFAIGGFGSSAALADVSPADGDQALAALTADEDNDGTPDLTQVLQNIDGGVLNEFTQKFVGGSTDYDAATDELIALANANPAENITAFFLTDGIGFYSAGKTYPENLTVNTFSVGPTAPECSPGEDIQAIADDSGGTCTRVVDPTTLTATLGGGGGGGGTGVATVEVRINGGPWQQVPVNALGGYSATGVGSIVAGTNLIEARVTADDGTQVTADVTVTGGTDTTPDDTCDGLTPTVTGSGVINGTSGDDVILGSDGDDVIRGLGGDDVICGLGGDDLLYGNAGNDTALGGDGADVLYGWSGDDVLAGGAGDDFFSSGPGADSIDGGDGNDEAYGGPGEDTLEGGEGDDFLDGALDDDIVNGGPGNDLLAGGAGDDQLDGGPGDDTLKGGTGDDDLLGGDGNDVLLGGAGADDLNGEDGDDRLWGGPDADSCTLQSADDDRSNAACETKVVV